MALEVINAIMAGAPDVMFNRAILHRAVQVRAHRGQGCVGAVLLADQNSGTLAEWKKLGRVWRQLVDRPDDGI